MSHIYILTNTINDKQYVGQSVHLTTRLNQHRHGYGHFFLQRAIKKYGWEAFALKTIEVADEKLDEMEKTYIKTLGTLAPNGYNLTTGGSNGRRSQHTKQKMSQNMKRFLASLTPEQVMERLQKKSIAAKRHYLSLLPEEREKYWKRLHNISVEQKQQRTIKALNTLQSKPKDELTRINEQRKQSLRQSHDSKTVQEKQIIAAHISAAKKGKPLSLEHRQKLSDAAKARWKKVQDQK